MFCKQKRALSFNMSTTYYFLLPGKPLPSWSHCGVSWWSRWWPARCGCWVRGATTSRVLPPLWGELPACPVYGSGAEEDQHPHICQGGKFIYICMHISSSCHRCEFHLVDLIQGCLRFFYVLWPLRKVFTNHKDEVYAQILLCVCLKFCILLLGGG